MSLLIYTRITQDPTVCYGAPCVRGLPIPVASVLGCLACGMTVEDILHEWPEMEEEDVREAIAYATWPPEPGVERVSPSRTSEIMALFEADGDGYVTLHAGPVREDDADVTAVPPTSWA